MLDVSLYVLIVWIEWVVVNDMEWWL